MRVSPESARVLSRLAALLLLTAIAPAEVRAVSGAGGPLRHVLKLAGEIGPRKTGTEADRRAVEYVRQEMESAGLQVTLQDVGVVYDDEEERAVGSWNVIGRLEGDSPDTIIVAAHHDSRSSLVPGANDNASGISVLLEVARQTARRPRRVSYLFVSFCAEEEDRLGSRHFVREADLSRVRAMIALELLGRGEILIAPVPKPPPLWAQQALQRAARATGAGGVAARPLWALVPRFHHLPFSSDHEPFLERNVPAFLLLGTYPRWAYHTTEDSVLGVRAEALDRSILVLDRLLRDLEETTPSPVDDPHYLPLTLFGYGLLVPTPVLKGLSAAALVGCALLLLTNLSSILSRKALGETIRVLIVTGASVGLGLSGLFASEALMERIHGVRYPWAAHHALHVAQAVACASLTAWIGLNLFRRIKPTVEPGPYLGAALVLPVVFVALTLSRGWPEIAVFMAVPSLLFILSLSTERITRKLAFGLAAVVPFSLLLTLEDYRALVDLGGVDLPGVLQFGLVFLVVLPLVLYLAHVASFQDCLHSRVWWWLSGRWVGASALLAFVILLAINVILPAYDYGHRQVVHVREQVDLEKGQAVAAIQSADSLRGVRLRGLDGRSIEGGETSQSIEIPISGGRVAFDAAAEAVAEEGSVSVTCTTRLTAPVATDSVSYLFTSRSGFRVPGRDEMPRHRYTFSRVAPQRDPIDVFRLTLPAGGDLTVALRAEFEDDLLGLDPEGGPRVFVHRGTIAAQRRLVTAETQIRPALPEPPPVASRTQVPRSMRIRRPRPVTRPTPTPEPAPVPAPTPDPGPAPATRPTPGPRPVAEDPQAPPVLR
jgi:peptidase M28-like protein